CFTLLPNPAVIRRTRFNRMLSIQNFCTTGSITTNKGILDMRKLTIAGFVLATAMTAGCATTDKAAIDEANATASSAEQTASNALSTANNADRKANTALRRAEQALSEAKKAQQSADEANE